MSRIKQIIQDARSSGEDPVQAVRDYLESKDSRISRQEAERLVKLNS